MSTNFDYYKVFYYAASLGSITLAAKELFLSQPTVSRLIQNLENDLGITLFIRTKKGLLLTPEGNGLRDYTAGRQRNDHPQLSSAPFRPFS